MIQQGCLKLKCQEVNHNEEIDFICYYEFCTGFRLNCFDCFKKGIHHTHSDDVKKVNSLIPFIETNNLVCENFIDDLNKYLETLNQSFSQFTQGIRNKYSLVKERLVNMNTYQINDYLNQTIKFTEYKESITKIVKDQINKLNHSFNNLYEQLQLTSFNYYQIDQNDVKIPDDLSNQGVKLYWENRYNEALEQFDESILINPNNKESLCYKGLCLKMLEKYEEAITWLDKAIAVDPIDFYSLSNKGLCLKMLNEYEDAIIWLDKALAIDSQDVDSLCIKGQCLMSLNRYEDAIIWLDKALAIDSKDVDSLCTKGQCLRRLNQYEQTKQVLHQALSLNPNHIYSLNSLGICLQEQKKYSEALIYYEKSLNLESNNQWIKNQKIFCEQQLKK
ncbi:unnamed protein product [Paramecium octaurelia]|uniref:Tetratricopeptide repeat protein n=1 Tax=Paramecium octaurelia TaxID=43137 RepID=A0A8S1X5R1_PAROT|nr:unnamed protein product [Paramecium octaurelia]